MIDPISRRPLTGLFFLFAAALGSFGLSSCSSTKNSGAGSSSNAGPYATYPADGHYNPYPATSQQKPAPRYQEYTEAPPPPPEAKPKTKPKSSGTVASNNTTSNSTASRGSSKTTTKKKPSTTSKTASNSASTKAAGSGIVYVVKPKDSLWSISRKYHTTISKLKSANGLSSDLIRDGQKLKIP